LEELRPGSCL
jgi:hypothetical protein